MFRSVGLELLSDRKENLTNSLKTTPHSYFYIISNITMCFNGLALALLLKVLRNVYDILNGLFLLGYI